MNKRIKTFFLKLFKDEFYITNENIANINQKLAILEKGQQTNEEKLELFKSSYLMQEEEKQSLSCKTDLELENIKQIITADKKIINELTDKLAEFSVQIEQKNLELQAQKKTISNFSENIKNNNIEMEKQKKLVTEFTESHTQQFDRFSLNIRNNNEMMTNQRLTFESFSINIKNVNQLIEQFVNRLEESEKRMSFLERGIITLQKKYEFSREQAVSAEPLPANPGPDSNINGTAKYYSIDYLDFENHFRGSRSNIMKLQKKYLPYFQGKSRVIDIGCGRGEFLELLKEEQIPAVGVDFYEDFVLYCKALGLNAVVDDGIKYLERIDFTDGIFVGQVIEHLSTEQLLKLCNLAYEKLAPNSYFILETPNPTSLSIYANAFYIDPSHVKPVHPLTLEYFLRKSGFTNIQTIYTEDSKLKEIPKLQDLNGINNDEFNDAMARVSKLLFGSQDYAIIAQKC